MKTSNWNRLIASAVLWLSTAAIGADTIKIAYIGALSGTTALLGKEILKEFRASADMVNERGGISTGQQLEVLPFDNNGNVQDALIAFKHIVDQNISFVTIGRSNFALAVGDALQKHNERNPDHRMLLFVYEAGDPALSESKCNFWTFRFNAHTDMNVNVLTDYMAKQNGIRKVYLINQDYAFGQAVSRAAKEMLSAKRPDIQIVGDDLVPLLKVKDFAPYITKIRAAGADSVLTSNWGNDLSLLVKAGNETALNVNYFTVLGGIPGTWANVRGAGGDRVTSLDPWHINAADPTWQARLLSYKSKYKSTSNMDYLPPMRIAEMLAAAVSQVGSADPVKVAHALEGMRFLGPSGESWMRREDHQMIGPIYVLRLVKTGPPGVRYDVDGSGYGWKTDAIVEAKNTVPPIKCQMERP